MNLGFMMTLLISYARCNDEMVTFDGTQYLTSSLVINPLYKTTNEISINFQTTQSSGLLFYASGSTGDFIAIELFHGNIRYVGNSDGFASETQLTIIHSGNFADGFYHQVNIEIGEFTKIYVYSYPSGNPNITVKQSGANDLRFDLDEVAYFMGMPLNEWRISRKELLTTRNFKGCLNTITFNKMELALYKYDTNLFPGTSFVGRLILGCNISTPNFLKSFTSIDESIEIKYPVNSKTLFLEMSLKTYVQTGIIMKYISSNTYPSIYLYLNKKEFRLDGNLSSLFSFSLLHSDKSNDDGTWHLIQIEINDLYASLSVDANTMMFSFSKPIVFNLPERLSFGGSFANIPGIIGCLKDVFISSTRTPITFFLNQSLIISYEEKMCAMKDLCFPNNPCKNGGQCFQNWNGQLCNCNFTGYSGKYCDIMDNIRYQPSCSSYFQIGYRHSGGYFVKPGSTLPFYVKCKMNLSEGKGTTIIEPVFKEIFVFTGNTFDDNFFYHSISYKASKHQINNLVAASRECRQYVRYNCYASTLMNSKESYLPSTQLGVRWYSRKGALRNYWAGGKNNSFSCGCASNKTCIDSSLYCNCDVADNYMRFDDGFFTEKNELPISKIKISRLRTNHRSSVEIGPLECTGTVNEIEKFNKAPTTSIPDNNINATTFSIFFTYLTKQSTLHPKNTHDATLLVESTNIANTTSIPINEKESVIVINSKLLYAVVISIGAIATCATLLFIVKRCWFTSNYSKARPHVIQFYNEDTSLNKNRNNFHVNNDIQVTNDIKLTVDHIDVAPSSTRHCVPTYHQNVTKTSEGSEDFLYEKDLVEYNENDEFEKKYFPRKGILKIKKDFLVSHQNNDGTSNTNISNIIKPSQQQKSLSVKRQFDHCRRDSCCSSNETETSELISSPFYKIPNNENKTVSFSIKNAEESVMMLYGECVQTLV
ncbi:contactin-associated protein like 5-3 [Hydra vulgaris]|uniref:contactin-associated protein like 5-3 n=1 Tax=Hydra vulgaris TaxID=6087 RepID=UPI001F5F3246|nr:contactin-associated protein like 5-3 [Hydra vulgaris]